MQAIFAYFESGKTVLAMIALWIVGSFFIFQFGPALRLEKWPGGIFFDMQSNYSDAEAIAAFENFGDQGRQLYHKHMVTDLMFMLLQLLGISALFIYATSKFKWSRGWFRILLLGMLAFTVVDFLENQSIARALSAFPSVNDAHIESIRKFSGLKQAMIVLIPVYVLPSLAMLVTAWMIGRKTSRSKQLNQ